MFQKLKSFESSLQLSNINVMSVCFGFVYKKYKVSNSKFLLHKVKMEYRKCFVPSCGNNSKNCANKIFVRIREDLREKWCREAGAEYYKVVAMYCCEDHFNVSSTEVIDSYDIPIEDLKNYHQHKLLNQEPRLKPTASFRNVTPNKSDNSPALYKLLHETSTTNKQLKRKYEDTIMPSTSSYSTLPVKIDVSTQCEVMMIDKSTNYKARKTASVLTLEVQSSQETSSVDTPSLFGCTSETEESTVSELTKLEFHHRKAMLDIIAKKPKMYLGLPKQFLWLLDEIVEKSSIKIDKVSLIVTLLKIKQNDSLERISDQFEISRTKLSSYSGTKLTASEVLQSKVIASLRVHVERVIRRVREFSLLKPHSVVNYKYVSLLDEIVLIVCGLINLRGEIIKSY
ncbi:hypothetical protein SFRURICE_014080 [Spodoptera frugiperda]|nr:hypothetical protein SFRURICE_014080 [Spodoptera frugiperda]